MLKTNVVAKTYRLTLRTPGGGISLSEITAESPAAARLKAYIPPGWVIERMEEL